MPSSAASAMRRLQVLHRQLSQSTSSNKSASLTFSPKVSLMDEPVSITAKGIPPKSKVTLEISLECPSERLNFKSRNFYRATESGDLDLGNAEALEGGDYVGVDPMGPLWSMKPMEKSHYQLQTVDITTPLEFNAKLFVQDEVLAQGSIVRKFVSDQVEKISISKDGMEATMFMPKTTSSKKLPLICTLYGGIIRGRIIEERSALFANQGFASLAIGYFGVGDLPKMYKNVRIEYFEKVIDTILKDYEGKIDPERVGLCGISKGGDLALSCAAFLGNKIKAAVIINASICSVVTSTFYKDNEVVQLPLNNDYVPKQREDGTYDILGLFDKSHDKSPESIIPFANCPADLLFLAGEDDHNFDSAAYARLGEKLMKDAGKTNYEAVYFPGVGHHVHTPYAPPVFKSTHPATPKGTWVYMGGEDTPRQHMDGQKEIWFRTIDFFKGKL